ncbi:hypothetical protein SCUCBS95973_002540 [Sporothrix curviconia]|uniref:Kinetochore-associated protein MTW1 n=1 Tax=Sporothrix curviconia TaxID=1260050 RepID=A0ABP0B8U1_9PEZI
MASSSNADTELLTEHFGYPPVSLLDDIINSVNILAERALNSVEQALLRQPPASLGFKPASFQKTEKHEKLSQAALEAAADEAHRHEVENGTHQLETLLCASIDRNFDKFEIYAMRNILCVKPEDRDWMRLAHYEGLELGEDGGAAKDCNLQEDDASIAHLHRRLQASLKLGHLLDVEAQRNEVMLGRLRALTSTSASRNAADKEAVASKSLAFLLDRGPLTESDAAHPLTTTTAFALSQLPALRQLSSVLRQKAPGLAAAVALDDEEEEDQEKKAAGRDGKDGQSSGKSWRRERLEYIEGTTRKHLERVRGLNLGRNGEMRGDADGTAQMGSGGGNGGINNSNNSNNGMAVEPEALTNILSILRENHGSTGGATVAEEAAQPDDEAMDES